MPDPTYQQEPCSGFAHACQCLKCLYRESAMRLGDERLEFTPYAVALLTDGVASGRMRPEKE